MKSHLTLCYGAFAAALFLAASAIEAADTPVLPAKFASVSQSNQSFDRFIVTYKEGSAERGNSHVALQNVQVALHRAGLDRATVSSNGNAPLAVSVSYQRKLAAGADLVRTSRKLGQGEANALMAQIAADPAVAHVQPDYMMQAIKDTTTSAVIAPRAATQLQTFEPDDPYYAKYQWHFFDSTGGANINNAWDIANGDGITVAVIDTGITRHPDLDTSLGDAGYDFISDAFVSGRDSDERVPGGWDLGDWTNTAPWNATGGCVAPGKGSGSSWHGTHVSGTVAELTNNGVGMAGIAHKAKVLPIRALGHCGGYTSDISDAIEWASGGHVDGVPDNTHPAQVINMSLGGAGACSASDVQAVAIRHAIGRGTTVVVSAGNSASDMANYSPASCPGVIAVASNGITGKRAYYSNYGQGVTISAPGGGVYANDAPSGEPVDNGFVWSTYNDGATTPGEPAYVGNAGTSMASPHVAGTVAMMLSAAAAAELPQPSPAQIRDILAKSVRAFPVQVDRPIGAGILDAANAVQMTMEGMPQEDPIALTKGMLMPRQSTSAGADKLYTITVPQGATSLNLRTMGGSGDAVLYVKAGSAPKVDGSDADFRSVKPGTSQAVVIPSPQAVTYYLRVASPLDGFSNISILADYKP